jgi:formate-nitrite transporter family protein
VSRSELSELTEPVSERDHVRGPDDAAVTLVQYGDFECPSCGDMFPVLKRIRDRLGNQLRFAFRHFPLAQSHPHAQQAAEAAEAAAAQGAFWRMHDLLYENQRALTRDDLVDYAAELGLDTEQFERELAEGVHEERVHEDFSSGMRSGVNGTPTFFINGERYDGLLEFEPLLLALADAGGIAEMQVSVRRDNVELRDTIDRSERGAPAAGQALRDLFSADEIFQRITATANEEVNQSARLLFFNGLAAGLVITLSFFARSVIAAAVPQDPTNLLASLAYPIGFVFIVLGRSQLYTENTLTPVTLVLTRIVSVPILLRVWGIVLFANVLGAAIGAYLLATTGVFDPGVGDVAGEFGEHALSVGWSALFWKGVFAGWLVAGMVWLTHAARDTITRFFLVYVIMFLIPAGGLFHCIIGACEVFYLVFRGSVEFTGAFFQFFVPVLLGNTVGGVVLVALLVYGMTADRRFPNRNYRQLELSWFEWLFGRHTGQSRTVSSRDASADSEESTP